MSFLGVILIIIGLAGVVVALVVTNNNRKHSYAGYSLLGIAAILLGIILTCVATVPAGSVGVAIQFSGVTGEYRTQGFQFKSPFVKLVNMNIQTQKEEVKASAASKDLQDVSTTIALNYHLDQNRAPEVYRDLGLSYIVKVADPAIQETVKQVTARHNAEDLILNREVIKGEIESELSARLSPRGIVTETVSITNFEFSPVFTAAIESKVSAQQAVFESQNKLERVKVEAQQAEALAIGLANAAIQEATGKAKAIQIVTDAQVEANKKLGTTLTPEILQYIMLDRFGNKIQLWVVPDGSGMVLPSPPVSTGP